MQRFSGPSVPRWEMGRYLVHPRADAAVTALLFLVLAAAGIYFLAHSLAAARFHTEAAAPPQKIALCL